MPGGAQDVSSGSKRISWDPMLFPSPCVPTPNIAKDKEIDHVFSCGSQSQKGEDTMVWPSVCAVRDSVLCLCPKYTSRTPCQTKLREVVFIMLIIDAFHRDSSMPGRRQHLRTWDLVYSDMHMLASPSFHPILLPLLV